MKSFVQYKIFPTDQSSYSVSEIAERWHVSVSTARRELERRVGHAMGLQRKVGFEQTLLGRATYGIQQPPSHKVVRYALLQSRKDKL